MAKTILLTGASTGIGAESARHLAQCNHNFVHDYSSEQATGKAATAIKFLIENDFINGETIDINGGLFMR